MFLILVRHTAVSPNPIIPAAKWPVSSSGRQHALALSKNVKPFHPAAIFTSVEPKAQETGAIIAEQLNLEPISAPNLHEHDRRNVPYFEDKAEFETKVSAFFKQPHQLVFGNETAVQALARFQQAIDTLLDANPTKTIVIVTHGTVLSLFVKKHNPEIDLFAFWRGLKMPDMVVLGRPLYNLAALDNLSA